MNLSYKKKIIKIAGFSAFLVAGTLFITSGFYFKNQNKSTTNQINVERREIPKTIDLLPKNEEKTIQNEVSSDFIIKEYNGSVAVFENGKNLPFKTTETMVSDLPIADRELLKKGINVCGEDELSRILEDYCS